MIGWLVSVSAVLEFRVMAGRVGTHEQGDGLEVAAHPIHTGAGRTAGGLTPDPLKPRVRHSAALTWGELVERNPKLAAAIEVERS